MFLSALFLTPSHLLLWCPASVEEASDSTRSEAEGLKQGGGGGGGGDAAAADASSQPTPLRSDESFIKDGPLHRRYFRDRSTFMNNIKKP